MDKEFNRVKYSKGVGYHPIFCKWWIKSRIHKKVKVIPPYLDYEICELYVPWWALPLEILHRIVFGHYKLEN